MASVFSRIIRGEIPAYKVAETDHYYAFLDINPLIAGHTLVIPKREEDYLFDLADQELAGLMVFAKKVAIALRRAVPCERIGVTVIGLEVPHAHVHLIPIRTMDDMNFSKPKLQLTAREMEATARDIRDQYLLVAENLPEL